MTIGIYCLKFNGTDKVYIGQSINIEHRFQNHKYNMQNNSTSNKLMDAYKLYGLPVLIILTECSIIELDILEQEAIELYNSIDNGYNTSKDNSQPPRLYGEDNGSSKYSNNQIESVFDLLVNSPEINSKEIYKQTGVSSDTVRRISRGAGHLWLKDKFPVKYVEMLSIDRTCHHSKAARDSRLVKERFPSIMDTEGNTYTVECFREFSRMHNLDRKCLAKVLRGTQKSHKGWKLWVQPELVL